ncbi:hypothetical protein KDK77_02805 [bacterium]|nr:hypothetical protein [bacterium]
MIPPSLTSYRQRTCIYYAILMPLKNVFGKGEKIAVVVEKNDNSMG